MMRPVVALRDKIYGEPAYSFVSPDCEELGRAETWVHPTSLALTIYGDVQAVLAERFGPHEPDVLPEHSRNRPGAKALLCVADYYLRVADLGSFDGVGTLAFPFEFEYPKYGLRAGWVSGLTQGLAGQTLLAAYLVSEDEKYLDAARAAGNLLAVDVQSGGAAVQLGESAIWFEEYAQPGVEPPLVLNGHLLALDFLYWMQRMEPSAGWNTLFDAGVNAAVQEIGSYQSIGWSYYDQRQNLATRKYHAFHVRQLERYAAHDDSLALQGAATEMRLKLYVPIGILERLLTQPSRLLVFLLVSFLVVWLVVTLGVQALIDHRKRDARRFTSHR